MIRDPDLASHHDEISDDRAAGYAGQSRNQAMPPDADVVRDLHEIVDLGALADDGIARRAAIDRDVGADLDIVLNDHAAGLRDFLMALRRRQEAEAVLANAGAGMNDHAVPDQGMRDGRVGADGAIAADRDARADDGAGGDQRARPDLGARSDDGERIDRDAGFQPRGGMHARALGAAARLEQRRWPQRARKQRARDGDKGPIRFRRHQHRQPLRRRRRETRRQQARAGARRIEGITIFGIVEKRDIGGSGRVERREISDAPVERRSGPRLRARERDDFGNRQLALDRKKVRHRPGLDSERGRDQNFVPPPNWKNCVRSYHSFTIG